MTAPYKLRLDWWLELLLCRYSPIYDSTSL